MPYAQRVVEFVHDADKHLTGTSLKSYLEESLKINPHDLQTLYLLKYYVEQEHAPEMDEAIVFINSLIDYYTKNKLYQLESAKSIKELLGQTVTDSLRYRRLMMALQRNSGIQFAPINMAYFDKGQLQMVFPSIILNDDHSIIFQAKSNEELSILESELFKKYSYLYSRDRSNHIKEIFTAIRAQNLLQEFQNSLICVTLCESGKAKFMFFGKHYHIDIDEYPFENTPMSYKEMEYTVWLI